MIIKQTLISTAEPINIYIRGFKSTDRIMYKPFYTLLLFELQNTTSEEGNMAVVNEFLIMLHIL